MATTTDERACNWCGQPPDTTAPRMPIEVLIRVRGFTEAEVMQRIRGVPDWIAMDADPFREHWMTDGTTSVGVDRREVTQEQYDAEVAAWMADRHEPATDPAEPGREE